MTAIFQPIIYDLTEYIDNALMDGRPHIRDRRIYMIALYATSHKLSIPELADTFTLSELQVLAALLYYEQHKTEIDAQEVALEEQYRHYGEN